MEKKRKRGNANQYLTTDSTKLPKTSKWRVKSRLKLERLDGVTISDDIPSDTPTDKTLGTSKPYEGSATLQSSISAGNDDLWWNANDDNSVWFDAMEDTDKEEIEEPDCSKEDTGDVPIYKGATLSVAESAVLILTFALRHSLNGECLSDLLTLISLHCATTNLLYTSLHHFRSFFSQLKKPLIFHSYCSTCEFLVKNTRKQCPVCKKDLKETSSYFVEIPIITQLQEFFNRSTFHSKLQHRISRPIQPHTISDIYDGELYRKQCAPGEFLDDSVTYFKGLC